MSKNEYTNIKEQFKEALLKREQDLIVSTTKVDSQQMVNRIIKDFEKLIEKEGGNDNEDK